MRLIIVFILILCMLPEVNAQSHAEEYYRYDRIIKTMKGYYNRGLYYKAVEYPDSINNNKYVNGGDYYFFARVYALGNEFDKALQNLEKAVKRGVNKTQIAQMYDLDGFRESNMNILYEMNYDKWYSEYLVKLEGLVLDSVYIKEIRRVRDIYAKNLKIRMADGDEVIELTGSLAGYYYTAERLDSLSFDAMVKLTLENGFPTYKSIGAEYSRYSRYLRYNMPDNYDVNSKDWLKIKAMIFAEMKKGTVFPFYYAAIEDYISWGRSQPFIYGTISSVYNKFIGPSGKSVKYENPEELNIRRRAVGLCSIQLEMWSEARELPESLNEVIFK